MRSLLFNDRLLPIIEKVVSRSRVGVVQILVVRGYYYLKDIVAYSNKVMERATLGTRQKADNERLGCQWTILCVEMEAPKAKCRRGRVQASDEEQDAGSDERRNGRS